MRASTASKLKAGQNRRITPQSSRARTAMFWTMCLQGGSRITIWRDEVEHVSHRHYSTGFFFGQPGQYTEKLPLSARLADLRSRGKLRRGRKRCSEPAQQVCGGRRGGAGRTRTASPFSWIGQAAWRIWTACRLRSRARRRCAFGRRLPKQVPAMSFVRHAVELSGK